MVTTLDGGRRASFNSVFHANDTERNGLMMVVGFRVRLAGQGPLSFSFYDNTALHNVCIQDMLDVKYAFSWLPKRVLLLP